MIRALAIGNKTFVVGGGRQRFRVEPPGADPHAVGRAVSNGRSYPISSLLHDDVCAAARLGRYYERFLHQG